MECLDSRSFKFTNKQQKNQLTCPTSAVRAPIKPIENDQKQFKNIFACLTGILKSGAITPLASFGWRSFTLSMMHLATFGSFRLQIFIVDAARIENLLTLRWYHTTKKLQTHVNILVFIFVVFLEIFSHIEKCKFAQKRLFSSFLSNCYVFGYFCVCARIDSWRPSRLILMYFGIWLCANNILTMTC